MTIMIHPVIQRVTPDIDFESVSRQNLQDSTFADHFDRQLEQKRIQGKDTLGVQTSKKANPNGVEREVVNQEDHAKNTKDIFSPQSVASVLGQFIQDLQDTAEQKDIAPGEWVAVLPDPSVLHKLAAEAGMGETDMSLLLQQMGAQDGELLLPDFFAVLEQHFITMQSTPDITVPETELPLLETLLSKMGFSSDELGKISRNAVKSEGKLNLTLLLEGLQQITPVSELKNIQLTDWELEQLQNILAQAGVSQSSQTDIFPEKYLEKFFGSSEKEFELSFERLQDMLGKAITDITQNRPHPHLPAFLKELDQVLSQTQFNDTSVGWTPVIQQSLNAVFREMQEAVELARKRFTEEMILEGRGFEEELQAWQKSLLEGKTASITEYFSSSPSDSLMSQNNPFASQHDAAASFSAFPVSSDVLLDAQSVTSAAQQGQAIPRTPQQLQLQVFQQISAAVMHGLRNDEHHLVLRLYPQELGEVKVDLFVRDEQISITFNMENTRVKEMLESNMEQFRENMEQKGFSLGECNVSVGQQDDFDSEWRRFMMSEDAGMHRRETLEDLSDDVLYLRGNVFQNGGREGALNLFV